jgi:sugar O-acyltransferase (sialic acid O-acetyltransferase NeuD family)
MNMEKIAIIGAGGFGREVKTLIDDINRLSKEYELIGFYDDGEEKGKIINGLPVLGTVAELNTLDTPLNIALALGNPKAKEKIISEINNAKISFPNLIHPTVTMSTDDVNLGYGNIITAGCMLTCNITLGNFVILNLMCTVGHDTIINDYCSFMPGINISGEVIIEPCVYVGTGAKIINQLRIGQNTTVGAGAVIIKDVPDNVVVVGNPGKVIKHKA